jgi:hypothetical protein
VEGVKKALAFFRKLRPTIHILEKIAQSFHPQYLVSFPSFFPVLFVSVRLKKLAITFVAI